MNKTGGGRERERERGSFNPFLSSRRREAFSHHDAPRSRLYNNPPPLSFSLFLFFSLFLNDVVYPRIS